MSRDWRSQLQSLDKSGLPRSKGADPSSPGIEQKSKAETPGATGENEPLRHSVRITRPERAGRAPYNFVPLPKEPRWYHEPPMDQTVAEDGQKRFSGHIDVKLRSLTRFYVRGMRTLAQFKQDEAQRREEKASPRPGAFQVSNRYAIPGSSLRGMIRTLVEILGASPLDPINAEHQLFYRAVASDDQPYSNGKRNTSFDPNAVAYKKYLSKGRGTHADPVCPIAKAGYLSVKNGKWTITPASKDRSGAQWYRAASALSHAAIDLFPDGDWKPVRVWFEEPKALTLDSYPHSGKYFEFGIVKKLSIQPVKGYKEGYLVRSGEIPRKFLQWIIRGPVTDPASMVVMSPQDVEAYCFDRDHRSNAKIAYTEKSQKEPCFYVEWKDFDGESHVTIGHTGHFRIPYEKLMGMANPCARRTDDSRWDLAQAVFGRTTTASRKGRATRVFFEDAISAVAPDPNQEAIRAVLGTPKPTYYPHYLVQESEEIEAAIHWDGQWAEGPATVHPEKAVVRGWKGYLHRGDDAPFQIPGSDSRKKEQVKVATSFSPAPRGVELESRIRFENLDAVELGALLTALDLPPKHAHRIGMAKPLGFGSMALSSKLTLTTHAERYGTFFGRADDGSLLLTTGGKEADDKETRGFKAAFAKWALGIEDAKEDAKEDLWKLLDQEAGDAAERARLKELRALLRCGDLASTDPKTSPAGTSWQDWQNATRYLAFDSFDLHEDSKPKPTQQHYNEYKHVGYDRGWLDDPTGTPQRGRWRPAPFEWDNKPLVESRRPLPPASQLIDGLDQLPKDPLPDFGAYEYDAAKRAYRRKEKPGDGGRPR
ncbi:MAG: TIGR03986 family CRISPR-associated RAMP protein [Bryobacterales bacterium]|nr:TIGR03986 family CRISPR-associated RAMP protein [Bryobacterales bacterium]